MIPVISYWPEQTWHGQITKFWVEKPLLLTKSNMLTNPQGQKHTLLGNKTLRLVMWKILGRAWLLKSFQRALKLIMKLSCQVLRLIKLTIYRKSVGWHGEQKINPHACYTNFVLDFLDQLIEQKMACSRINSHKSVKSAYHDLVDTAPIGQHPNGCTLITGVFNRNPLKPKYESIWDFWQVLF